jgi:hypothetical protein
MLHRVFLVLDLPSFLVIKRFMSSIRLEFCGVSEDVSIEALSLTVHLRRSKSSR